MILWLTLVGAAVLVGVVSWWMIHRGAPDSGRHDNDWGDWPSDQMGL